MFFVLPLSLSLALSVSVCLSVCLSVTAVASLGRIGLGLKFPFRTFTCLLCPSRPPRLSDSFPSFSSDQRRYTAVVSLV